MASWVIAFCLSFRLLPVISAVEQSAIHPLPPALAAWTAPAGAPAGDYFDAVQPTELGYLVWSDFPVRLYVQPAATQPATDLFASEAEQSSQAWVAAVVQAVQEWAVYLPLALVNEPEAAEIQILRVAPSIQPLRSRPGLPPEIPRIRAAETSYRFVQQQDDAGAQFVQRFTIQLSPSQTADYTLATARHELGHALGIWGHSPLPTDALYFSQVRRPAAISARDIRTLKRIYQQPTRLGWPVSPNAAH